jgi:hypothetical protein
MAKREWSELRAACPPVNREAIEHHLSELYRLMDWPAFEYVTYAGSPGDYSSRCNRHSGYWRNGENQTAKERQRQLAGKGLDAYTRSHDIWRDLAQTGGVNWNRTARRRPNGFDRKLLAAWNPLITTVVDFCPNLKCPLVLEKPMEAHFNADERPHREDGPAVIWQDGVRSWWFNGVSASRRFIEEPPTIPYINRQVNAERRRVLIERYGEERYLKEMHAQLRSEDDYGKLWVIRGREIPFSGQMEWTTSGVWSRRGPNRRREDTVFVEVINSTSEPDGTFRKYFLRVPPSTKTPKQAIGWSFRTSKKYKPKVQT